MSVAGSCLLILATFALGFSQKAAADWDGTKGTLSLQSESFVSPDYQATTTRSYQFIGAGVRTSGLGPNNRLENLESGLQLSLDGQFAPQATSLSYLNIRQIYWQQELISVGRKLENWSLLDEHWNLGVYQPQFRWNSLTPESQGLTGIFVHLRGKVKETPWGLILMGTPVFIPDQGPGYSIKDGKFEAENPWFHPPQENAVFGTTGAKDTIKYQVNTPDMSRVVFNAGYAAQAYWGAPQEGFLVQASFAYKPMNTLSLALQAQVSNQESIDLQVNPVHQYHQVASLDTQYNGGIWEVGVGALAEKPQDPKVQPEWTARHFGESSLVSPFAGVKIGWVKLRAMALSVKEPEESALGPQAEQLESVLAHRYPFQNAGALEASTRYFWAKSQGIVGQTRYTQGSKDEFSLWTGSLRYQVNSAWSLSGQMALVRAVADTKNKTVYANYEDNDYVQAGVVYVF